MRRGNLNFIVYTLVSLIAVTVLYLVFSSRLFEKEPPQIAIEDEIFWNLKAPLPIKISDDSGIKSVAISLSDGQKNTELIRQSYESSPLNLELNLTLPKTAVMSQKSEYEIIIEAIDVSKWSFFTGNKTVKNVKVVVDSKAPDLYVLNHSYAITKGGSAAVVFKATDERLKYVYIDTNYGKKFIPTKFYKDGYFASLIAWPATKDVFTADVVAIDYAGNVSKSRIRFFYQNKSYRTSAIKLDDQTRKMPKQ